MLAAIPDWPTTSPLQHNPSIINNQHVDHKQPTCWPWTTQGYYQNNQHVGRTSRSTNNQHVDHEQPTRLLTTQGYWSTLLTIINHPWLTTQGGTWSQPLGDPCPCWIRVVGAAGGRLQAFWHTRQRFAASLACASAACYLLGIGDRRLGWTTPCWGSPWEQAMVQGSPYYASPCFTYTN